MKPTDLFGTFIDTLSSVSTSPDGPRAQAMGAGPGVVAVPPGNVAKDEAMNHILTTLGSAGTSTIASLLPSLPDLKVATLLSALETLQTTRLVRNVDGNVSLTEQGKAVAAALT